MSGRWLGRKALVAVVVPAGACVAYAALVYACTATAYITLSPVTGPVGQAVAVTVSQLKPDHAATARWDGPSGRLLWSGNADGSGNVAFTFVVPAGAPEWSWVQVYPANPKDNVDDNQLVHPIRASFHVTAPVPAPGSGAIATPPPTGGGSSPGLVPTGGVVPAKAADAAAGVRADGTTSGTGVRIAAARGVAAGTAVSNAGAALGSQPAGADATAPDGTVAADPWGGFSRGRPVPATIGLARPGTARTPALLVAGIALVALGLLAGMGTVLTWRSALRRSVRSPLPSAPRG